MSELNTGHEQLPSHKALLDEIYQATGDISTPGYRIDLLIGLADQGHEAALKNAAAIARMNTSDFYDGHYVRDAHWHQQYAIARIAGMMARVKGLEPALELAGLIKDSYPAAEALMQVGEAGFSVAFSLSLSHVDKMVPGTREEYLRRIATNLAASGNIAELYSLQDSLKRGFESPLEPPFESALITAALVNEDAELTHKIVDGMIQESSRDALKELIKMARGGDQLALAKAIGICRDKNYKIDLLTVAALTK